MEKKSIFNRRINILPYDYPSLLQYKDAIRHSYWIDTEYNFTTDINDFKVGITDNERDVIKKTMLSIAQKHFGRIYTRECQLLKLVMWG